MRNRHGMMLAAFLLVAAHTAPASAQDRSWQNRWYWGGQAGFYLFSANGSKKGFSAGGHWFITAGRSALYLSYDQLFFDNVSGLQLNTGQTVNFGSGNRIQALIYAVPTDLHLQVLLGGGFAIQRVTDAEAQAPFTGALDKVAVDRASTKAFLVLSAGVQARFPGGWVLFGQYQFQPASDDFMIRSQQHSIIGGLRFSLTDAEEVVSTER